jgi:endonuclease/exonuclease/phosphatase family metal-dependent hydrolase
MADIEKNMKGIFNNIYWGGKNKLDQIAKFIQTGNHPFAVFSELNHFTENSFQKWSSSELGLPYTNFLETPHGFHLGIASRYKLQQIKHDTSYPFHHGYILTWIEVLECCVLVTHLSPFAASSRLEEAKSIVHILLQLKEDKRRLLLVGDLNTLSSSDSISNYAIQILAKDPKLKKKFSNDEDEDGLSIDFRPMNTLTENLVDIGKKDDHSVPTAIIEDKMHAMEMRLDYCLASKPFLETYTGMVCAETIKSIETRQLSDHYPLEITF